MASRHCVLPDGRTIPAEVRVPERRLEMEEARRVMLPAGLMDKRGRRLIGRWLADRLGPPSRINGRWWTDQMDNQLAITIRDDAVFVEFVLVWC